MEDMEGPKEKAKVRSSGGALWIYDEGLVGSVRREYAWERLSLETPTNL